jgi:hypothetical protein
MAVVIALLVAPSGVPAIESSRISHDSLLGYAGTYDTDQFFSDPRVSDPLSEVADADLDRLQRNLSVRGSIDLISGWLAVAGNAPHAGTEEEAVVCIHPDSGNAHAAIFSKGAISVLTMESDYVHLPLCVKDWITQVNSRHLDRLTQPDNTRLVNYANPLTDNSGTHRDAPANNINRCGVGSLTSFEMDACSVTSAM